MGFFFFFILIFRGLLEEKSDLFYKLDWWSGRPVIPPSPSCNKWEEEPQIFMNSLSVSLPIALLSGFLMKYKRKVNSPHRFFSIPSIVSHILDAGAGQADFLTCHDLCGVSHPEARHSLFTHYDLLSFVLLISLLQKTKPKQLIKIMFKNHMQLLINQNNFWKQAYSHCCKSKALKESLHGFYLN